MPGAMMGQRGSVEESQGAAMLGFFGFVMAALMMAYLANEGAVNAAEAEAQAQATEDGVEQGEMLPEEMESPEVSVTHPE